MRMRSTANNQNCLCTLGLYRNKWGALVLVYLSASTDRSLDRNLSILQMCIIRNKSCQTENITLQTNRCCQKQKSFQRQFYVLSCCEITSSLLSKAGPGEGPNRTLKWKYIYHTSKFSVIFPEPVSPCGDSPFASGQEAVLGCML